MKIFFLSSLFFIANSCNTGDSKSINDLLNHTNKVRLIRIFNSDTLTYDIVDKEGIEIFKEIIDVRDYNSPKSVVLGEIIYMSNNKVLLKASISDQGIEFSFNNKFYHKRITYRAGMYFSEIWQR